MAFLLYEILKFVDMHERIVKIELKLRIGQMSADRFIQFGYIRLEHHAKLLGRPVGFLIRMDGLHEFVPRAPNANQIERNRFKLLVLDSLAPGIGYESFGRRPVGKGNLPEFLTDICQQH